LANMHPKGSVFISFGAYYGWAGWGGCWIFWIFLVPNVFSKMFHKFSMCSPICSQ
jgi:hypothetical protein